MSKRKQYTAEELTAFKERLREHGKSLFNSLPDLAKNAGTFDGACELRSASQHLASTLLALQHIDDSVALAAHGPIGMPFRPEDCGLEDR